jgi:V/A-type H+-transporting ATPase subunit A
MDICYTDFEFENFNEVIDYFKKMINICKQMNYSVYKSEAYENCKAQLDALLNEKKG